MEPPSTITRNDQLLPRRFLDQQLATFPALPLLSIKSIHLPWIIDVDAFHGFPVTLGDVFDSIYSSLRINVTPAEFNLFRQEDRQRAVRAYERRHRRLRSASTQDEEKRAGMKRIDFFMNRTMFCGISNAGGRPDEWELHVA
jgi:hypothetical protein